MQPLTLAGVEVYVLPESTSVAQTVHLEKQLLGATHAAGDELSLVRVARKLEGDDASLKEEETEPLLPDAGQAEGYFDRHAEETQSEIEETEKVPAVKDVQ